MILYLLALLLLASCLYAVTRSTEASVGAQLLLRSGRPTPCAGAAAAAAAAAAAGRGARLGHPGAAARFHEAQAARAGGHAVAGGGAERRHGGGSSGRRRGVEPLVSWGHAIPCMPCRPPPCRPWLVQAAGHATAMQSGDGMRHLCTCAQGSRTGSMAPTAERASPTARPPTAGPAGKPHRRPARRRAAAARGRPRPRPAASRGSLGRSLSYSWAGRSCATSTSCPRSCGGC